MRPVVEADNRLRRLGNGIADGENNRKEIAGDGKSRDTLFAKHGDEHVVSREHHDAHSQFGQEGGESDTDHVPGIAQSQQQRGQGPFQRVEPQFVREPEEIGKDHRSSHGAGYRCGQCRTNHSSAQREHHVPVEYDIDDRSHNLNSHGILRRTVKTDEHHANTLDEQEKQAGQQPEQIVHGILFEQRAASQCVNDATGANKTSKANKTDKQ